MPLPQWERRSETLQPWGRLTQTEAELVDVSEEQEEQSLDPAWFTVIVLHFFPHLSAHSDKTRLTGRQCCSLVR